MQSKISYDKNEFLTHVLKNDFHSFVHKCFKTLNPKTEYKPNWHIQMLCEYLEAVRKTQIKRLIINIPPRNLKSICINVAWTAWLLALKPSTKIISASYSQILSTKHSLDAKFIMESNWYQNIFPNIHLSKTCKSTKITTTSNGFRLALHQLEEA